MFHDTPFSDAVPSGLRTKVPAADSSILSHRSRARASQGSHAPRQALTEVLSTCSERSFISTPAVAAAAPTSFPTGHRGGPDVRLARIPPSCPCPAPARRLAQRPTWALQDEPASLHPCSASVESRSETHGTPGARWGGPCAAFASWAWAAVRIHAFTDGTHVPTCCLPISRRSSRRLGGL